MSSCLRKDLKRAQRAQRTLEVDFKRKLLWAPARWSERNSSLVAKVRREGKDRSVSWAVLQSINKRRALIASAIDAEFDGSKAIMR